MKQQRTQEEESNFRVAVDEVAGHCLYLGILYVQPIKYNNLYESTAWAELQSNYPQYDKEIASLAKAYETGHQIIEACEEDAFNLESRYFKDVRDPFARHLLSIIFFSRISNSPEQIDNGINKDLEYTNLFTELNVPLESQDLFLSTVVEAVLEGRLRVTYEEPSSAEVEA